MAKNVTPLSQILQPSLRIACSVQIQLGWACTAAATGGGRGETRGAGGGRTGLGDGDGLAPGEVTTLAWVEVWAPEAYSEAAPVAKGGELGPVGGVGGEGPVVPGAQAP